MLVSLVVVYGSQALTVALKCSAVRMCAALLRLLKGVLILAGLARMGLDSGKVFIAPFEIKLPADVKILVELDGAPQAFTKVSDNAMLVVTTRGVSHISSPVAASLCCIATWACCIPTQ